MHRQVVRATGYRAMDGAGMNLGCRATLKGRRSVRHRRLRRGEGAATSLNLPGRVQRRRNRLILRMASVDHLADVVADRLLALAGN